MVLTFAGGEEENLLRIHDSLKAICLSRRRQNQEPMAPSRTSNFVDTSSCGVCLHSQVFNQRSSVIQPLFLIQQTCERGSRYGCERVFVCA